jgi:predicted metal-dependent hydrolase
MLHPIGRLPRESEQSTPKVGCDMLAVYAVGSEVRGRMAEQIILAHRSIPYTLTISDRARYPRLIIAPGVGLRVVTPAGYDRRRLLAFISARQSWILKHLDRMAALPATPDASAHLPSMLTVLGTAYPLAVGIAPVARVQVVPDGTTLAVLAPDMATARAALEGWARGVARGAIAACVEERARVMAVTYGRIAIRDQRTRWGSCSGAGNLNFNWRLVLAPPAVLDYVVVHELAHRIELNHGSRFWRIVARYCPAYLAQRAWLREHGAELRF